MRFHKAILGFGSLATVALLAAACGVSTNTATSNPTPTPFPTNTPTPTFTPGPTPTPTPAPKSGAGTCSWLWSNDNGDGTFDFYEVDIPGANWTNATVAFSGKTLSGYFVLGYDPSANTFLQAGMSTSGAVSMSVSNESMGTEADFHDTATHTYYDATGYFAGSTNVLGAQSGSGGTGDFTGPLSNPDPSTAVTPGAGAVTMTINGVTGTIGGNVTGTIDYAVCNTSAAFAPGTPAFLTRR